MSAVTATQATKKQSVAYINDIPAVVEAVFGPPLTGREPRGKAQQQLQQTAVQNVVIPEDLLAEQNNKTFQWLSTVLSSSTTPQATIHALDYLIDTPLRDHHRFRPYLQKYASQLLEGCAHQLEHFLQNDYPKVLLEVEGEKSGGGGGGGDSKSTKSKLFEQSQRLLQSVAISAMNLIISSDLNKHITVSSFSAFYNALLQFRVEATKAAKSERLNYTLLYIIADDHSLWIENDVHRALSPAQYEAIFATLHQLLAESAGTKQLTNDQWRKAKLLFGDIERLQSRIFGAINAEDFLQQANAILKEFPASAFAAEHNFSPMEVISEGIFQIVKKEEKEKVDVQSFIDNLTAAFKNSEPIVPFVQKVLKESELLFQDEKKKKREKVKVCPDEINYDLLDFSFLNEMTAEGQQSLCDDGVKKIEHVDEKKDAHADGPKCCDHSLEEKCQKKDIPLPKPSITIVGKSSAKPAEQFLEQVTALSSTNNLDHSNAIVAYLNRNLDDLIRLHPGAFEPHLNDLVNSICRLYNQLRLYNEMRWREDGQEQDWKERTEYFNALTALLKRIFAYAHLQRALDFENAYPLLLVTVSVFHGCLNDVDYGFGALKDILFKLHHSVQMGSRLLFTVRMLTFLEDNYGGSYAYFYGMSHQFTKGARRLFPGVNAASLGDDEDQVVELLAAVGLFLERFEVEEWSYADSSTMARILEPPFAPNPFIYPLDFVKRLLYIVVKSQGESIWRQYYRAFPKEVPEPGTTTTTTTTTPLATFVRLALNANFQGQRMCTGKFELRRLTDWPPSYYGQTSSHAVVPFDDLMDSWDFADKKYPDNSAKVELLTREILPKFNSAYEDYRWIADTFKELRKHLAAYGKNPKQFGGQVISKLFESSLRLLEHYLKQTDLAENERHSNDDLQDAILAIVGFFESLLNIEQSETDNSTWPFPKYQLQVQLDDYADLLEAVLTVRYHYGLFAAPKLLSLDWLLKYKPNCAVVLAAVIRVFNRATLPTTTDAKKQELYVLITLSKFLSQVTIPNRARVSRDERLQVLVRQVRTVASLETILVEAGQLMERFKGSILEREHLYLTWQVVDELLSALVTVKTDMMKEAVEAVKKTKTHSQLVELLERRLWRFGADKAAATAK